MYLLAVLCGSGRAAQNTRDDWRYLTHSFDLNAHLTDSLADAPLTSEERAQIYKLIDDKTIHDSFTDNRRDEERETVLSARIGSITLAQDGSKQVIVQGPEQFCGATGNCSIWIFVRSRGRLKLVLATGGNTFIIKKTVSRGFHDVATYWHMSAFEGGFGVYRWNGTQYESIDCYSAKFDLDHPDQPPVTTDCPTRPQ